MGSRLNILVLGSGGREHALAWRLGRDGHGVKLLPGNGGTGEIGNLAGSLEDHAAIAETVRREGFDLVVIGPEAPLVAGLADRLRAQGTAVFGPGASGARLEGSKIFCKEFFLRHHIPTARAGIFTELEAAREFIDANRRQNDFGWPLVIKADGLAAGKGVVIAFDAPTAHEVVKDFMAGGALGGAGRRLLIEEALTGPELSVLALTDGHRLVILPAGRDHKRIFDRDQGPNTGGMGVFAPAPEVTPSLLAEIRDTMLRPTLAGLRREGIDYRGVLFAGLMLTPEGPKMLEYNCRFGDPETEAVLPLLGGDFGALLYDAARGALREDRIMEAAGASCCVILAAAGYPGKPRGADLIQGLAAAEKSALIFHAGTRMEGAQCVTSGGRVLAVVGQGSSVGVARARAYAAAGEIHFSGMQYRRDIGAGLA